MAGVQGLEQISENNRCPWTEQEDQKLIAYMTERDHKTVRWAEVPELAGLNRSKKGCSLRWTKYLMPGIKRGNFTQEEDDAIINLHSLHGNKWAYIAKQLPGRTNIDIKNRWKTFLKKKLPATQTNPPTLSSSHYCPDELAEGRAIQVVPADLNEFEGCLNFPIPEFLMDGTVNSECFWGDVPYDFWIADTPRPISSSASHEPSLATHIVETRSRRTQFYLK